MIYIINSASNNAEKTNLVAFKNAWEYKSTSKKYRSKAESVTISLSNIFSNTYKMALHGFASHEWILSYYN